MKENNLLIYWGIPYMTVCGAIYHLSYWNTFKINGLAYISLIDIIKSSVEPIIGTIIMAIVGMLFTEFVIIKPYEDLKQERQSPLQSIAESKYAFLVIPLFLLIWLSSLLALYYAFEGHQRWLIFAGVAGIVPAIYCLSEGYGMGIFKSERIRRTVIQILIFLPIYSFVAGKIKSEEIFTNHNYQIVEKLNQQIFKNNSVKLLGTTENYFIIGDLQNHSLRFVSTSSIDSITLNFKRR